MKNSRESKNNNNKPRKEIIMNIPNTNKSARNHAAALHRGWPPESADVAQIHRQHGIVVCYTGETWKIENLLPARAIDVL
jgi:hypothetical protein